MRRLLPALLVVLGLAGCGDDAPSGRGSGAPDREGSESPAASAGLPPGTRVSVADLSFEVPGDWRVRPPGDPRLDTFGPGIDLVVVGPDDSDGQYPEEVTVDVDADSAEAASLFEVGMGLPDAEVERDRPTTLGPGDLGTAPFPMGPLDLTIGVLHLDRGDGTALSLSVVTPDEDRTRAVLELAADTLATP